MADTPRIITARKLGLSFVNLFGQLGPEEFVTGHYSAGARAPDWKAGVARAREFHRFHRDTRGWGGCAYHFLICDDGALICMRPTLLKGAHVGAHNSRNLGVNCPGTTGDRPTAQQRATFQWLLRNAHTTALPSAHRTDLDLREARLLAHKDWAGHATNACAGLFSSMFRAGLTRFPRAEEEELPSVREEYPDPVEVGGVVADHRHVSPEEAEEAAQARRGSPADAIPEADPDFDDDAAAQGAEVETITA